MDANHGIHCSVCVSSPTTLSKRLCCFYDCIVLLYMWKKWKTNTWKRFRPLLFSSCWYYTMLQTKFRQTKYKIILKSYSVWHIICWVYLLSAQATSIQHLRRDIPNEKQRLRLFSSQKWLNNIKKFECKSVLLLLWIWFFFSFCVFTCSFIPFVDNCFVW